MMARVTMLAMHGDGVIVLPPPQGKQSRPRPIVFGPDTEPPLVPSPTALDEVRPLQNPHRCWRDTGRESCGTSSSPDTTTWSYKTLVGAQMRYIAHDRNGVALGMLGFSTAAWALEAPRPLHRMGPRPCAKKNPALVIDNPRFLILTLGPHPKLGEVTSLALVRRRLPGDWSRRYNITPVLVETFVEIPRFTDGVYRASGWIHVGKT